MNSACFAGHRRLFENDVVLNRSGTGQTVRMAQKKGIKIINFLKN